MKTDEEINVDNNVTFVILALIIAAVMLGFRWASCLEDGHGRGGEVCDRRHVGDQLVCAFVDGGMGTGTEWRRP